LNLSLIGYLTFGSTNPAFVPFFPFGLFPPLLARSFPPDVKRRVGHARKACQRNSPSNCHFLIPLLKFLPQSELLSPLPFFSPAAPLFFGLFWLEVRKRSAQFVRCPLFDFISLSLLIPPPLLPPFLSLVSNLFCIFWSIGTERYYA